MTAAKKKRTRLTPEARRSQLLSVAKSMILAHGLQNFSMEALARSAHVSSPLVYNYFNSRQEILRCLLACEYQQFTDNLTRQTRAAASFDEIVRLFIVSNFDHYAPGNIIPILASQPEIAQAIEQASERNGREIARFLVKQTASTFKLTKVQAELLVKMSSGASIAAAEYASLGRMPRNKAIDAAQSYILSGIRHIAGV